MLPPRGYSSVRTRAPIACASSQSSFRSASTFRHCSELVTPYSAFISLGRNEAPGCPALLHLLEKPDRVVELGLLPRPSQHEGADLVARDDIGQGVQPPGLLV